MRLTRLTKLAVTVALVAATAPAAAVGTVATAAAAPGPGPGARPDHPVLTGKVPAAKRALEAIEAVFADDGQGSPRPSGVGQRGGELTQELLQLRLGFDQLSPQDQQVARAYLARPTDGTEYFGANYGKRARPTNDCKKAPTPGSNICVHWARKTADAPPPGDQDGDGLPDQVERTRDTMNEVWDSIIDQGGYRQPLPDDGKGFDDRLDIYLVDIGGDGLYGYCGPEYVRAGRATAAYCVLDDDYSRKQFPTNGPLGNLRVTAAHEFFHAVQFAYDEREDPWLMESTATWVEDELYDSVNDNRYYLTRSALSNPKRPLDTQGGSYFYGNWIWWRYLTERFPEQSGGLPVLVRRVWELADNSAYGGTYSMAALSRALQEQEGERLADVFADFSQQNRFPDDPTTGIYEEGHAYRKAPLSAQYRLDASSRPDVAKKSPKLAHMSSTSVAFFPEDGYADDWSITVKVNLPSTVHGSSAQIAVFGKDGTIHREDVPLNAKGNGEVASEFSSSTVKRVELTLTNGDSRYDCNEGTQWSCRGIPGPSRTFNFKASTWQPAP